MFNIFFSIKITPYFSFLCKVDLEFVVGITFSYSYTMCHTSTCRTVPVLVSFGELKGLNVRRKGSVSQRVRNGSVNYGTNCKKSFSKRKKGRGDDESLFTSDLWTQD